MVLLLGAGLPIAFAFMMTFQVAIGVGLYRRVGLRGLLGLLPPLAPVAAYWAFRERMYIRTLAWGTSALAYLAALGAAFR